MLQNIYQAKSNLEYMKLIDMFINIDKATVSDNPMMPAISLFSGAGLSDIGYEQAGFKFVIQAEIDSDRAELCQKNFQDSLIIRGDISETYQQVTENYQNLNVGRLHLLTVTPPCQGMSSSNPGRGKISKTEARDQRNSLLLKVIPIIQSLHPRVVVVENVRQILSEHVVIDDVDKAIIDVFKAALMPEYILFTGVIQLADYGVPQTRTRAIIVAIHTDELGLNSFLNVSHLPWPKATHVEKLDKAAEGSLLWISLQEWFSYQNYPPLDSCSAKNARYGTDRLHSVPDYEGDPDRYLWISEIPKHSGRNAYQNTRCVYCQALDVPEGLAVCPFCGQPMVSRPHVKEEDGTYRLIKGFHSSYRRMASNKPAATIMTNSSHLGSDYKIHPWQNRVLSIRECAELQTVPRYYDWAWAFETKHTYLTRQVIGEALPAWFTYIHGLLLRKILGNDIDTNLLAVPKPEKVKKRKQK